MLVKNGIQYTKNRLVKNSVAHGCFVNMSPFRVADIKIGIRVVNIAFCNQFFMQAKNPAFQVHFKIRYVGLFSFSSFELVPCLK